VNAAPAEPEPKVQIRGVKRLRDREPAQDVPRSDPAPDPEAFDYQKAIAMMDRESRRERSSGSRRTIWAPLAVVLALLGIGIAGFMYHSSLPGEAGVRDFLSRVAPASRVQGAPAPAAEPVREIAPSPVTDATKKPAGKEALRLPSAPNPLPPEPSREVAPAPVADATPEPAPAPAPAPAPITAKPPAAEVVHASTQPESTQAAPVQKPAPAKPRTAKAPEKQPEGTAHIVLAISPRGEIYVDGEHHGATPPITTLDLKPGLHRIEVRNGSRTPYLTYMTVQAGDVRHIRYDFDTSKAVHPRGKRTLAER
jgi:hypothetical protein